VSGDGAGPAARARVDDRPDQTAAASVTVVDLGLGNVGSVLNMVRRIGGTARLSHDPDAVRTAPRLLLPGVGAFDHGVHALRQRGLFDAVLDAARAGTPLLGLCLGMQLLTRRSEEGVEEGLGLIDAECRRFTLPPGSAARVPHVGWNEPTIVRENPLIAAADAARFYFTHSYHLVCRNQEDVLATAHYGYAFPAVVGAGRVFGVQFHPEKSHRFGMTLFRRFLDLAAA